MRSLNPSLLRANSKIQCSTLSTALRLGNSYLLLCHVSKASFVFQWQMPGVFPLQIHTMSVENKRAGPNLKPQAGCHKSGHLRWEMRQWSIKCKGLLSQYGISHLHHIHFVFHLTFIFPSRQMSQTYLRKYQVHSLWPLCTQRELAVSKAGSSHSSNRCSDSL